MLKIKNEFICTRFAASDDDDDVMKYNFPMD